MESNYNPSSWKQRHIITFVAFVGTCISLYLGLYQWQVIPTVWDPIFGDGTKNVLTSPLSHEFTEWIRIPDAMLGVFAYFSDLIFALAGSKRRWQDRPWLVFFFGIDVIPVGLVSMTLVLLQGFVVKFWCFLCLTSAAISFILIILAYDEIFASLQYLHELKKRTNWKIVWWAFWGYPCDESIDAGKAVLAKRGNKNVGKNP